MSEQQTRHQLWYAKNRDKIREAQRLWRLNNREATLAIQQRYREKHREKSRERCRNWWNAGGKHTHEAARIKRKYGITLAERDTLLIAQNGRCAICADPLFDALVRKGKALRDVMQIDHDHTTGKVRGLLCGQCNRGVAHFQDNVEILREAIAYLEQHGEK